MSSARPVTRTPRVRRPATRGVSWVAALALAAATVGVGGAFATAAPASAAPVVNSCADPSFGLAHTAAGSDSAPTVYVGGDFEADTAGGESVPAEMGGVFVVRGNATFATGEAYGIGVASGSPNQAPDGSRAFVVGGDLTVDHALRINPNPGTGAQAIVGGTVSDPTLVEASNAPVTGGASDPLADYQAWPGNFQAVSATLVAKPSTATSPAAKQGSSVTLTGDGASDTQVFTIPASLDWSDVTVLELNRIPAGARVIINVEGSAPTISYKSVFLNGTMVDPNADGTFGLLNKDTIWNFPDATAVTLGGSSQFVGSILVPNESSSTTLHTSTNGRVYVAGDLTQAGDASEMHSFVSDWFPCGYTANGTPTPPATPTPATPASPTVTQAVCDGTTVTKPTVTPADTTGITYTVAGDVAAGSTVTVTATADTGYTLEKADGWTVSSDGSTATTTITLDAVDCDTTGPTDPSGPTTPTNPSGPTDPSGPSTPTTPAGPTMPADATTPVAVHDSGTGTTVTDGMAAAPTDAATTDAATTDADGTLAVTGSNLAIPAGLGALLLALGGVVLVLARRRTTTD